MSIFKPGLVCSLFSLLVYFNTFQADFVFDDKRALVQNPDVRLQTPLRNLLVSDYWGTPLNHSGSHGSYRPLTVLSFRLNYYFFGLNPCSYHVINVVLFCLTTYLFCCVLSAILRMPQNKIYTAGLLFAVHPIHTEAVAGIVGRADILATLFCLLALLSYQKACGFFLKTKIESKENTYFQPSCVNGSVQTLCHRKSLKSDKKRTKRRTTNKGKKQPKKSRNPQSVSHLNHRFQFKDLSLDGGAVSDESTSTTDTLDSLTSQSSCDSSKDKLVKDEFDDSKQLRDSKFVKTIDCNQAGFDLRANYVGNEFEKKRLNNMRLFPHLYRAIVSWTQAHKPTVDGYFWLVVALLCGTCSVFSKESGYCTIPLCLFYDLFISNDQSRRKKAALNKQWFYDVPKRFLIGSSFWFALMSLRLGLPSLLSAGTVSLPKFSPSDNPAAASDSFLTRALSFNYLMSCNLQMIFMPTSLSFDWSMDAIALVTSLKDRRNLATCMAYGLILKMLHFIFRQSRRSHHDADCSHANVDEPRRGISRSSCSSSEESIAGWFSAETQNKSEENTDERASAFHVWKSHRGVSDFAVSKTTSPVPVPLHLRMIFGFIVIALGLLPASNLLFYVGFVLAERVLFLPSVGSCILLVEAGECLAKFTSKKNCFAQKPLTALHRKFKRPCFHSKSVANKSQLIHPLSYVMCHGWLVVLICFFAAKTVNRNQDWKNEISLYRSGSTINPAKALANMGSALKTQGCISEAENAYIEALRHRPNMADVHYNLGLLYQETGRREMAEKRYRQAIHYRPAMALAYLNLGVVLSQQNRLDEAKTVYKKAASLENQETKDPGTHTYARISSLYNLGCIFADGRDHQSAIDVFKEALSYPSVHYKPHSLYNMLGQSLFHLGLYSEAETWFKASLDSKPDHVPAHLAYAQLLGNRGEVDRVLSLYERAMKLDPESKAVYSHYSSFLMKTNRLHKAVEVLTRAIEAPFGRDDHELVSNAASVLRKINEYDKAEKYYTKAATLAPNVSSSYLNLGAIQHIKKKYKMAEESYLKALRLDPKNDLILENLSKLKHAVKTKSKNKS